MFWRDKWQLDVIASADVGLSCVILLLNNGHFFCCWLGFIEWAFLTPELLVLEREVERKEEGVAGEGEQEVHQETSCEMLPGEESEVRSTNLCLVETCLKQ